MKVVKKAKYEAYINNKLQYSCVTTCREADDIIEIIKDMFMVNHERVLKIYQIQDGSKNLIYASHAKKRKIRTK